MHDHAISLLPLVWFASWCVALGVLVRHGLLHVLARNASHRNASRLLRALLCVAVALFANVALNLHDAQFDLTEAQVFTPDPQAVAVVRRLREPVKLTYFQRADDPDAWRVSRVLAAMAGASAMLSVEVLDPDRAPDAAARYGIRLPNVAVLESGGRVVRVESPEAQEIALGLQRLLREREVKVCFIEGFDEHPSINPEFVTHQDSGAGHAHNDPQTRVVETTARGIVRLRRVLETLGYEVRALSPGDLVQGLRACSVAALAGPRVTPDAGTVAALRAHAAAGRALWLMLEPGFEAGPALRNLLAELGVVLPRAILSEPRQHLNGDPGMLALTAYEPHPITQTLALTTLPGARPLTLQAPAAGLAQTTLMQTSTRAESRAAGSARVLQTGPAVLAVAVEGRLAPDGPVMRAIVTGDSDFASNAYLPYASNRDLALAMLRWLVAEDATTPVASRIPVPEALILTPRQQGRVFVLAALLAPAVMGMIGVVLWWRRR
jgi:hypothetical protein